MPSQYETLIFMKYPTQVTLAGATGLVGGELLSIISSIQEVSLVKAVTRRPLGKIPPRTDNIILDFSGLGAHAEELRAPVFICCLGSTIKQAGSREAFREVDYQYVLDFAKIAESVGAEKLLVVSAMGANSNSRIFYNQVKGDMERDLKKLKIPQVEIFRPSLILGARKQHRPAEKLAQKMNPVMNLILSGPLKKYRAIQASDIAKAMTIALLDFHPGFHIYESDKIQRIVDEARSLK